VKSEFKVYIIETKTRFVWVLADDPLDARRILEERYIRGSQANVIDVEFDVDMTSRRFPRDTNRKA
jgi:hypothetical protein